MANLESLYLKNFRIFKKRKFILKDGINIIYGKNGSGKTSFMEAIYLLNYGKSFRTRNINELPNGANFYIEGNFLSKKDKNKLIFYFDGKKKNIILNEKKVKLNQILNKIFSLFINSTNIEFFFKNRKESRKTIDIFCAGINTLYLKELLKYNRILKHKNKLLKSLRIDDINYKIWTEKLSNQGKIVKNIRKKVVDELNIFLLEKRVKIKIFEIEIESLFHKEKKFKRALTGPHVDYVKIYKNGKDLSSFGSTGINKAVFFDILYVYTRIFKEKKGFSPVLMLDDFDSDLDVENLIKYTEKFEVQSFLSFVDNKHFDFFKYVNFLEV